MLIVGKVYIYIYLYDAVDVKCIDFISNFNCVNIEPYLPLTSLYRRSPKWDSTDLY